MTKLVPLHCLIITVGPTPSNNNELISQYFPDYDVISASDVRYELSGNATRRDIDGIVFSEIHRRVETKLRIGERVIVNAANLRRDGRVALANIGISLGVPVFYLICDNPDVDPKVRQRFLSVERDVLRGDGIAEVIDLRACELDPILKLSDDAISEIRGKFNGITVIGDVHGMYQSLLSALDWARSRRHFVIFLGDIVDYGQGTLECADEVYRMVMRGNGELIIGNHERKIARWIDQSERGRHMMKLSDGNRVTTQALNHLGNPRKDHWMSRFRGLVSRSPLVLKLDNHIFTHAAIHPSWWIGEEDHRNMENYALFGEFDFSSSDSETNRPQRTYNWIDAIPENTTVFVGHDARSHVSPVTLENKMGGKAVFLDTGSGKGGYLSSVDLRFTEDGLLRTENFTRH